MVDTKLSGLTYKAFSDTGDIFYTTDDTGGTPASRKVKAVDVVAGLSADTGVMEAGTSGERIVTPDKMHRHPGQIKAWASFTGSTGAIRESYNITSISRTGTGAYTVTIATDFGATTYAIIAGCTENDNVTVDGFFSRINKGSIAAGSFSMLYFTSGITAADPDSLASVMCLGGQ